MKRSIDLAIYAVHAAFWSMSGLARLILGSHSRAPSGAEPQTEAVSHQERTAPFSRALLVFHSVAFGVMYFGVGNAVFPGRVPIWFSGQRLVGALVILSGGALMAWAFVFFRSWRFRAKLDKGHELATGGPFRYLRHPIYMALNLLALGTAIWIPTVIVWIGAVLMVIGSDLRARAEESLLVQSFGDAYREYCSRTRRFVPGIY